VVPAWIRHYRGAWLRPDVIAGVVIWSVVVPQAVAYAQIAGLPPQAGLMAAPGALLGYALLGTSRSLVVSATTATAAVSAAAVGPLAHGDADAFAALSATLALVAAVVFVLGGVLRLGALADLISAALNFSDHRIDVVGHIPSAAPKLSIPHVDASDLPQLVGAAFGVLLLSTEGSASRGRWPPRAATAST
jgi:MFS superfamily sulfate permease-like transporter